MNLTVYTAIISVISAAGIIIAAYILHGIGLSRMLRACSFRKPFFAFLPFFRVFALGTLAEAFDDRREVKRHGKILLFLSVAYFLTNAVYLSAYYITLKEPIMDFITSMASLPDDATSETVTAIIDTFNASVELAQNMLLGVLSLATSLFSMLYSVYNCFVLFKVFAIFAPNRAFLFSIISIFSPLTQSIMLFVVRNRHPQHLRWRRQDDYTPPML